MKFNIKETIKTLIMAPAVAGLAGFFTYLIVEALSSMPANVFYHTPYGAEYGLLVSAVTFALIFTDRLDIMLLDS